MKQIGNTSIAILIILMLFTLLFVFFMYTFLHESGHAIAGLFFGQSLTELDVSFWDLNAHVGMVGGELTQPQLAIRAVAGASLPLLIWAIFISLVPRKAGFTLESLKFLSSMTVVNTLLVWMILPVLFLLGKAPPDDVTNFLRYSQMSPLLLTLIAATLYVAGWKLFLSKTDGLQNALLLFRTTDIQSLNSGARITIPIMTGIMAFSAILVFVSNATAEKDPLKRLAPPQDFVPVAQIDLSTQAYSAEALTQFTLDETAYVSVFIAIRDIDTTYFDLSVTGQNEFNSTVLHGEGYNAHEDGGLWEKSLQPGTYQLVLTSHQSPGSAAVYVKLR